MSNRIALVTGGTGGIGTAICQELFTEGFTVVAGYNSGGNHEKAKAWQDEQRSAALNSILPMVMSLIQNQHGNASRESSKNMATSPSDQ